MEIDVGRLHLVLRCSLLSDCVPFVSIHFCTIILPILSWLCPHDDGEDNGESEDDVVVDLEGLSLIIMFTKMVMMMMMMIFLWLQ